MTEFRTFECPDCGYEWTKSKALLEKHGNECPSCTRLAPIIPTGAWKPSGKSNLVTREQFEDEIAGYQLALGVCAILILVLVTALLAMVFVV